MRTHESPYSVIASRIMSIHLYIVNSFSISSFETRVTSIYLAWISHRSRKSHRHDHCNSTLRHCSFELLILNLRLGCAFSNRQFLQLLQGIGYLRYQCDFDNQAQHDMMRLKSCASCRFAIIVQKLRDRFNYVLAMVISNNTPGALTHSWACQRQQ